MNFDISLPTRILFGAGKLNELHSIIANQYSSLFILTGQHFQDHSGFQDQVKKTGTKYTWQAITGEPTIETVIQCTTKARERHCDAVIAAGGGSALDTGKAVAALLTNSGDVMNYLEVIGEGKNLTEKSAPYIAIPTTAGTGTEVTRNAVLKSSLHRVKVSMRSPYLPPLIAIVDPELTLSMPPETTASTGMDALTQLIESFVTPQNNPFTDALCIEGIKMASSAILTAYQNGSSSTAREYMSLSSLFSGITLAHAKLGAVHGIAGPLGGMIDAPHGAVCARLLPLVTEANIRALQKNNPNSESLKRYKTLSCLITGKDNASLLEGVAWLHQLCDALNIRSLDSYGLTEEMIPELIDKSQKASSMKGNPVRLDDSQLSELLTLAIH